jgi:8-oxo-dGTP pyrophosphatase MutT (NUDIX family)
VLALLFPLNDELHLALIKRTDDGRAHGGQISFPGGRQDVTDADLRATALRETFEEIGIPANKIEILGALTPLYIPVSYNHVQPFVGFAKEKQQYILSESEVQYVIEVPIMNFFEPGRKIVTKITPAAFPHITLNAPAYQWENDHLVWGATAMIISELEELLIR